MEVEEHEPQESTIQDTLIEDQTEQLLTEQTESHPAPASATRFPLATVRRILKEDEDIQKVKKETVIIISKLTVISREFFVAKMARELLELAQNDRRKTIQPQDLQFLVHTRDQYDFLTHTVPYPEITKKKPKATSAPPEQFKPVKRTEPGL
ncbi:hypothetical protein BLNAU_6498 [Blattamonas nauphoetae]|uniref:Transcription factor CBF/NF-Y/archaeal histone domain-containing protein n=1 Tax=Blattamonas nauphoetae TaxID=2049346 RepID=A0ABQ9Y462_9EUKA|nr:hypothetical protein BLNAU_6498 [Blattamonas nauphoetae]